MSRSAQLRGCDSHVRWAAGIPVANLTRKDGEEFLRIAATVPIRTETTIYVLAKANQALADLRAGKLQGATVLRIG